MKKFKNNNRNKRKGYVLISVLVMMMIMLAITFILSDLLFSEYSIARNQKAATIAFNLAESGVSEAVWRLQNEPGAKNTFLTTTNGQTNFAHDPALLDNGSYDVNITNTAIGAATITSTGYFQFGLKTAQRKIVVQVTKPNTPPPYNLDGAIFTGGSTGEEDITITGAGLNITNGGSLVSNRDIWFTLSQINVAKDIIAKRNVRNFLSNVTVGGVISQNDPGTYTMPAVDVTSDCAVNANSYKCLAQNQNQYFTSQQFSNTLKAAGSLTYSGVVYIAGNQGLKIDWWRSVTVNGILVIEGSLDVGGPFRRGDLTINHVANQPSGVITLSKFTAWANSVINVTGLIYVGDRFSFDPWYNLNGSSKDIDIEGGILARRFEGRGIRNININFNRDLINEALLPNPVETPIIQTQHWEEEY